MIGFRARAIAVWLAMASAAAAVEPGGAPSGQTPAEPAAEPPASSETPARGEPRGTPPAGVEERSPYYFAVRYSVFRPDASSDTTSLLDDGYSLDLTLGVRLATHVALELAIGQYRCETGKLTAYDPTYGQMSLEMALEVMPATASLRAFLERGPVTVSAVAGVGWYLTTFDAQVNIPGYVSGGLTEKPNPFGLNLGAALDYSLSDHFSLGVEARRHWAKTTLLDEKADVGGLTYGAKLSYRR